MMIDRFNRELTYLRISVADRCNLKCVYCMPSDGAGFDPWDQLLSYDELLKLVRIFTDLGIRKLRLTGGEPLVRPGIEGFIERIRIQCPEIQEIALSTNGVLLKEKARALRQAGITRMNISLDTLRRGRFERIAKMDRLVQVLEGIEEACQNGFGAIKINTVLMRTINEDEILDLVRFAVERSLEIRFIELMPTDDSVPLRWKEGFFSTEEAQAVIEKKYTLEPADAYFSSPAKVYSVRGTSARVGFISPMSCAFCSRCNRLRLKADGALKTCLHGKEDLDLKMLLRSGVNEAFIKKAIEHAVFNRPEQHFLNDPEVKHQDFQMSHVGG